MIKIKPGIIVICLVAWMVSASCGQAEGVKTEPDQSGSSSGPSSDHQVSTESQTGSNPFDIVRPKTMTIKSGKNAVQAEAFPLSSHNLKTNIAMDFQRKTPQEMAGQIQYLTLDPGSESMTPFTPYIKGIEVFGQYELYDDAYNPVQFFQPSGLSPQTYLFHDVKPGNYIVVLTASFETDESRSTYQYFFGVVVPKTSVEPSATETTLGLTDGYKRLLVLASSPVAARFDIVQCSSG